MNLTLDADNFQRLKNFDNIAGIHTHETDAFKETLGIR